MRRSVWCLGTATHDPVIADHPSERIELGYIQKFSLVYFRTAHDLLQHTFILRRLTEVIERRFKLLHRQMFHGGLHKQRERGTITEFDADFRGFHNS